MRLLKWTAALLVLLLGLPLLAQTHSATVNWLSSATTGAGYNVYRADCTGTVTNGVCSTEGTFNLITGTLVSGLTFTDNTVTGGSSYSYYITAVCNTTTTCPVGVNGESKPSAHIAGTIPSTFPPQTPSGTPTLTTQ